MESFKNKKPIALPTDTVYGIFYPIGERNKQYINEIKNSPPNKFISVMFASVEQATPYLKLSNQHLSLISANLPGHATIIVKTSDLGKEMFEQKTVGVRIPSTKDAKQLVEFLEEHGPMFASSANLSGNKALNTRREIIKEFENEIYVPMLKRPKTSIRNPESSLMIDLTSGGFDIIRHGKA